MWVTRNGEGGGGWEKMAMKQASATEGVCTPIALFLHVGGPVRHPQKYCPPQDSSGLGQDLLSYTNDVSTRDWDVSS